MFIAHFALKNEWEKESLSNSYSYSLIKEKGYIPCYKIADIKEANINLPTLKDYIILCIDTNKLNCEIKYDNYNANVYGKIDKDAVVTVLPYTFDENDNFVPSDYLLDFVTIDEVCTNLNIKYSRHKYFHDGTSSKIILLNDIYIIKIANETQLKAEATFAETYQNPMLQKAAYIKPNFEYIVYIYIPGDVMHTVLNFDDLASSIKQIVSSYKRYLGPEFGYISRPSNSWTEFLKKEVDEKSEYLPDEFNFKDAVYDAINELDKYPFEKKLIHGDFGTHNFIERDEKFVGAIDPIPIAGDSTYDLIYALVSNVDLLPYVSIDYLTGYTGEPKNKVVALFKVILYCRICKCAKYNKEWLDAYLDLWYTLFK